MWAMSLTGSRLAMPAIPATGSTKKDADHRARGTTVRSELPAAVCSAGQRSARAPRSALVKHHQPVALKRRTQTRDDVRDKRHARLARPAGEQQQHPVAWAVPLLDPDGKAQGSARGAAVVERHPQPRAGEPLDPLAAMHLDQAWWRTWPASLTGRAVMSPAARRQTAGQQQR